MAHPGEQPDSPADVPGHHPAPADPSAAPEPADSASAPGPVDPSAAPGHHPDPAERATLPDPVVDTAVGFLDLLAEPSRLRLLWALRDGELGVSALAATAGCTPTAASQHLAKLRLGGLVDQRADGRARLYRLRGSHIKRLVEEVVGHAEHAVRGIPYEL